MVILFFWSHSSVGVDRSERLSISSTCLIWSDTVSGRRRRKSSAGSAFPRPITHVFSDQSVLWYLANSSLFLARNSRTLGGVPLGNSVGILILPGPNSG